MLRQNADGTRFAAGAGEEVAPAAGRRRDKRGSRWTQLPAHDQWEAWQHDLASRPQPADLAQLARSPGTHPLRWAVPDDYDARPAPRLLKRLTRCATRKKLPAGVVQSLGDWLNTAVAARSDAGWALESIAWCHLLPRLATSIAEPLWRALYETLFEAIGSAADSAVYDEPVRHQLLNAELPLTLAFVLPELQPCRELVLPASSALSFGLVELLDGEGLVCAAHVEHFRGLLACWTRCALLDDAAHWGSFDDDARAQFACLARQALRLTRPDGTLVLSRGTSGQWCPELIQAAVARSGSRKDRRLAKRVLPDKDAPKDDRPAHKLPPPSVYSEWGEVCVMRTAWWRKCPQFACLFGGQRLRSELTAAKHTLWSGDVAPQVRVDGQLLERRSDWIEVCWHTDDDVDYLELEADCDGPWQLQRQMLLARKDHFLLLSDVVLGPQAAAIEYELRLPLADGIRCEWAEETREGLLGNRRSLCAVMPLSLPEWRAAPAHGALQSQGNVLQLTITETARRLYAPLLFDLVPQRVRQPRTWRQLTVAEELQQQPREVAVGYRVQLGRAQWLLYRSLAPRRNRSVLGQNVADEFVAARFSRDGELDQLIEIQ